MTGDYKLLKSINGRMNFAHVIVEVEYTTEDSCIEMDIQRSEITERRTFDTPIYSSWIESAIAGAKAGIKILERAGILTSQVNVRVKNLIGTAVDTSENAIFCASALAVCLAIEPAHHIAELYIEKGEIRVRAAR